MKLLTRSLLALCALVLLSVAPAFAQGSEEQFRTAMIARLAKAMPGATLTLKPGDSLAVMVKGGPWNEAQINLNRIYAFCQQASAADCETEKTQFVAVISEDPDKIEAPEKLRLLVRDQQYVDSARGTGLGEKNGPDGLIAEPLGGGLYAILAADAPKAYRMFTGKGLEDLHMGRGEAWALARRQTLALLPPLPEAFELRESAVIYQGHELGGSLLLDLPAWADLAKQVGPNLLVSVVSDDVVFVGIIADGPDLEKFRKAVEEDCTQQARCISPYVYRFRDGHWVMAE